jgi:hypothetical protein
MVPGNGLKVGDKVECTMKEEQTAYDKTSSAPCYIAMLSGGRVPCAQKHSLATVYVQPVSKTLPNLLSIIRQHESQWLPFADSSLYRLGLVSFCLRFGVW